MNLVANNFLHFDEFALLQIGNDFGIRVGSCSLYDLELFASSILYRIRL